MTLVMFDSVTVSEAGNLASTAADAVAGYIDGRFKNFAEMAAAHPTAHHLSIAVTARDDADALDVEPGDAVPSQAGPWAKRQIARGIFRPVLYSDRSQWPDVRASVAAVGLKDSDVRYWIATLDNVQRLLPGADATQWTSTSHGRNLDESVLRDDFWGVPVPPAPVDPHHYLWFPDRIPVLGKLWNERAIVQRYDVLRATQTPTKHPNRLALWLLRVQLGILAGRVWTVAHLRPGKPAWNDGRKLGWRFQELIQRYHGGRLV